MKKIIAKLVTLLNCLLFVTIASCTDLSSIENDIQNLTNRVNSLEDAVSLLKKAYNENKIITSVTPTASNNGYVLTFSDNQSITVVNGSNDAAIIKSIEKNEEDGVITLIMQDESVFKFNLDVTYPTSINILTKQLYLTTGGTQSFRILVNPSNAYINTNVAEGKCSLVLNLISATRASYLNEPKSYEIESIEKNAENDGIYDVAILDKNVKKNYEETITLVVKTKNANNEEVYISSEMMNVEWSNGEDFHSFKVGEIAGTFTGNNIIVQLPKGSSVKNLCPTFISNGQVTVNGIEQISGVSTHDFSSPIDYSVVSSDGSKKIYTVYVKMI